MVKAVGFDVGHTLIKYDNPLNWSSLYRPALEKAVQGCNFDLSEGMIISAIEVLTKYNTRINYREVEVTSDKIFDEILCCWNCSNINMNNIKSGFYSFFQTNAKPFPETIGTLIKIKQAGIKTGILTDVAYGMDNEFSLRDISRISKLIDIAFTSVDVGYRKPNSTGFIKLLSFFDVSPNEMLYVGDEEKDIVGANNLGILSVLVNRSNDIKDFGQNHTIISLSDIVKIIDNSNHTN